MKLRCTQNRTPATNGILGFGAKPECAIIGITQGTVYDGNPINILSGGGERTVSNEVQFLIYNDQQEWEFYDINLFEPIL